MHISAHGDTNIHKYMHKQPEGVQTLQANVNFTVLLAYNTVLQDLED